MASQYIRYTRARKIHLHKRTNKRYKGGTARAHFPPPMPRAVLLSGTLAKTPSSLNPELTPGVCLRSIGPGHRVRIGPPRSARAIAKGQRALLAGSSDPMIEAGAPSTGEIKPVLSGVCLTHRGSHGRTTRGPAQGSGVAKGRPRSKGRKKRGQERYRGCSPVGSGQSEGRARSDGKDARMLVQARTLPRGRTRQPGRGAGRPRPDNLSSLWHGVPYLTHNTRRYGDHNLHAPDPIGTGQSTKTGQTPKSPGPVGGRYSSSSCSA
jgi:hypothetical protein